MKKILQILIASLLLIGLDQGTKIWVRANMPKFETYGSYLGDTVQLIHVENTGAFLSLGSDWPDVVNLFLLSILPLVFLGGLMYYILKNLSSLTNWQVWAFTLIFSGGVGNLIDRLFFNRHVTDFLLFQLNTTIRTGILNVADMYVTGGILVLLVIYAKEAFAAKKQEDVVKEEVAKEEEAGE